MQRYSLSVDKTNVLLKMVMYTLQYKVKNDLYSILFSASRKTEQCDTPQM